MAGPWNRHCANCTGTLSFVPHSYVAVIRHELLTQASAVVCTTGNV